MSDTEPESEDGAVYESGSEPESEDGAVSEPEHGLDPELAPPQHDCDMRDPPTFEVGIPLSPRPDF